MPEPIRYFTLSGEPPNGAVPPGRMFAAVVGLQGVDGQDPSKFPYEWPPLVETEASASFHSTGQPTSSASIYALRAAGTVCRGREFTRRRLELHRAHRAYNNLLCWRWSPSLRLSEWPIPLCVQLFKAQDSSKRHILAVTSPAALFPTARHGGKQNINLATS